MGIKKRGKNYYSVYVSPNSRETWIALNCTARREAQQKHERIMTVLKRERTIQQISNALLELAKSLADHKLDTKIIEGRDIAIQNMAIREALKIIDDIIPAPALTAVDLWEKYKASDNNLKPSTEKTKEQRFGKFAAWYMSRDIRTLKESDCRRFLKSLETEKSQTINNYISVLSSVWSASPELKNPWGKHLRQKSNVERKKAFSRQQVNDILKYCRNHNHHFWFNAVNIGYYTGLRLSDVVHLSWTEITDDGYIDLIPNKTERTKNRVRIRIHPELHKRLKQIEKSASLYLFSDMVSEYQKDRSNLTKQFSSILKAVKIKTAGNDGWGFHSLRHTFITEAKNAGIRIEDIQAVVGHIDEKTTEGYYHGIANADLSKFPSLSTA